MNQSALIGGTLLAGFALFIASRNRLSVYGRILWGDKPAAHSQDESTAPKEDDGFTLPSLPTLDDFEAYIDSEVWGIQ